MYMTQFFQGRKPIYFLSMSEYHEKHYGKLQLSRWYKDKNSKILWFEGTN